MLEVALAVGHKHKAQYPQAGDHPGAYLLSELVVVVSVVAHSCRQEGRAGRQGGQAGQLSVCVGSSQSGLPVLTPTRHGWKRIVAHTPM